MNCFASGSGIGKNGREARKEENSLGLIEGGKKLGGGCASNVGPCERVPDGGEKTRR